MGMAWSFSSTPADVLLTLGGLTTKCGSGAQSGKPLELQRFGLSESEHVVGFQTSTSEPATKSLACCPPEVAHGGANAGMNGVKCAIVCSWTAYSNLLPARFATTTDAEQDLCTWCLKYTGKQAGDV